MKHLMLVLALVLGVSLGLAQGYIYVTPTISSSTVALCTLKVGNTIVKHASDGFAAAVVGQKVYGVGVPYGATVAAIDGQGGTADSITLSAAPTIGGIKSLQLGVFEGTDYSIGDWMGFPFRIYEYAGDGGARLLVTVNALTNADILDSIDVVLFSSFSDTLGLDNGAAAILASEAYKVIGIVPVNSFTDLGTMNLMQASSVNMIVPREALWGRMIARAAIAPTTVSQIRLRFGFW
jgi:hypothetical protein